MIKNFTNSRAADLSETKQDGRKWKKKNMFSKNVVSCENIFHKTNGGEADF